MLRGLNHITIAVNDLDSSFNFYTQLLGFKPQVRWNKGVYLNLENLWLCLSLDTAKPARDYSHIAFDCSEQDFPQMAEKLRAAGIVEWKKNTSEGESICRAAIENKAIAIQSTRKKWFGL